MKVIHLHGFPEEERLSYRAIIYNNLVTSIKVKIFSLYF